SAVHAHWSGLDTSRSERYRWLRHVWPQPIRRAGCYRGVDWHLALAGRYLEPPELAHLLRCLFRVRSLIWACEIAGTTPVVLGDRRAGRIPPLCEWIMAG